MAARSLNHAYSARHRLSAHRVRRERSRSVQFRALTLVRLLPQPVTPSLLALHLALDSRTVSDLVSRLEQSGWVRRGRDLPDRRAVRLELTEEGERMLEKTRVPAIATREDVGGVVAPAEVQPVLKVLRRVRDSCLEKLGYRPGEIFALGPPETE